MDCTNCGRRNILYTCPDCGAEYPAPPRLPAPSKRRNRLPGWILFAMFLFGLAVFLLSPTGDSSTDYLFVDNGVLYFQESCYSGGPVLTIPETVDGETVTALSVGCFENNTTLTTIVLPSTLTEIRERAFSGCRELRGIELPDGIRSIGAGAFRNCTSMEAAYLPSSLQLIGTDAFEGCASMLYLFYSGLYENLYQLYPQQITPYTWAICLDGEFPYLDN